MKKILSLLIIAAATISCTDDDIRTEQDFSNGPKVIGFGASLETMAYFSDLGPIERNVQVSVIGNGNGQYSDSPILVSYVEAPEEALAGERLAVEGLEYDYVDTFGTATIEPGASFVSIPITVHTAALSPTEKTVLYLKLTTVSEGSTIGEQYQIVKIAFVGCLSTLQGNYTAVISWNNGTSSVTRTDEVVTQVGVNTFRTRYVANYPAATFSPQGYEFIDICDELTLPDNQNLGGFSNDVLGVPFTSSVPYHGLVAPDGNSFQTAYDVVPYPGLNNRVFRTTYTRN
ncbi:hypothetical protein FLJC2902T_06880 [Flavobacterium limnosediminis JC2902]|uniref:DUF1735 domain-containing protein n=1 Tax=Flavobacterium limnosediminis JC2902 TaxID=1341181 RepID=V6SSZ9_9FLAO|nr:hypothetical protein [Flavobacterium limnosediminis]ESU29292.1 hypothetical protein FLJC2902T_06880 [Flavobacterium limnosediminis JC2902]